MKYADGPVVEVETHIDAPSDFVWPLVTDIGVPEQFSSEFRGAEWIDGCRGPEVGSVNDSFSHVPHRELA